MKNGKRAVHPPTRRAMDLHLILSRMSDKEWEEWLDGYRAGVACQEILKDFLEIMEELGEDSLTGTAIKGVLEALSVEVDKRLPKTLAGLTS